jgi:hypothetical protein
MVYSEKVSNKEIAVFGSDKGMLLWSLEGELEWFYLRRFNVFLNKLQKLVS